MTFGNTPLQARGFTLLELMVALTLAAMLLQAGLPSFTTFLRNAEVRSTSEAISNGLRTARTEASRLNRPVSFTFVGGGDPSWSINIFDPTTGALLLPPIQQYSRFELGSSTSVATVPANAVAITFNGLGRVVSPSPIATANLQQIDVRSTTSGEARTLRIFVDDLHGIRLCDPDPALRLLMPPDARAC
jgi:type IV fimbrial biogenesis protein FimT